MLRPGDPWSVVARPFHVASYRMLPRTRPVIDIGIGKMWVRSNDYLHVYLFREDVSESVDMSFFRILFIYARNNDVNNDLIVNTVKASVTSGLDLADDMSRLSEYATTESVWDASMLGEDRFYYQLHDTAYILTDVVSFGSAIYRYVGERNAAALGSIIEAPETHIVSVYHAVESIALHAVRRAEHIVRELESLGFHVGIDRFRRAVYNYLRHEFWVDPMSRNIHSFSAYVAPMIGVPEIVLKGVVYKVARLDAEAGNVDVKLARIGYAMYRYGNRVEELVGCDVLKDRVSVSLLPERDMAELSDACRREGAEA